MWEGGGDRTELQHIDHRSIGHNHVSFPFSWAAQRVAWGPTLLGTSFLYHILSPTGLVSKLIWLPVLTKLYNNSRPLLHVAVTIALIQPIHSQAYNSDIPRPGAPVIYIGVFPILTARLGHRSIYNNCGHLPWWVYRFPFCYFCWGGCPRAVIVKVLNWGIVVSEFELQSHYYVHLRTNTLILHYPTNDGLNSTITVRLEGRIWHYITHKGWYAIKQRNLNRFLLVLMFCSLSLYTPVYFGIQYFLWLYYIFFGLQFFFSHGNCLFILWFTALGVWTAVSTLLGLISSVYRNLHHWRLNQLVCDMNWLFGRAVIMTSWFGVTRVRYEQMAQL